MDAMERFEIEERERAKLHAQDVYERNKRSSFIGSTVIAIIGVVLLALLALLYAFIFVVSPGILLGMAIFSSMSSWVLGFLSSVLLAGIFVGGIYATFRDARKTIIVYAVSCVLATVAIVAIGGFRLAEDFLLGRFYRGSWLSANFGSATSGIPSVSISNYTSNDDAKPVQQHANAAVPTSTATAAAAVQPSTSPAAASSPVAMVGVPTVTPSSPAASGDSAHQVPESTRPPAQVSAVEPVQTSIAPSPATRHTGETAKPSFDCTKASHPVEQRICANPELAALDRTLTEKYSAIRSNASPAVRREQLNWFKGRNDCKDDKCIADMYLIRISQIEASYKP